MTGEVYRTLDHTDLNRVRAHLLQLAPQDRYTRFHGAAMDSTVIDYANQLDPDRETLIGCFERNRLVGLGEAHFGPGKPPDLAELAVSVDGRYRGHGIGLSLIAKLTEAAAARGARAVKLYFMPENSFIPRIVRRLGGKVDMLEAEGTIDCQGRKGSYWYAPGSALDPPKA